MAKGKVKVQTDKPSVWDKTIGFIKDKIYDAKVQSTKLTNRVQILTV